MVCVSRPVYGKQCVFQVCALFMRIWLLLVLTAIYDDIEKNFGKDDDILQNGWKSKATEIGQKMLRLTDQV
jgi:hypothetical protein